MSRLRDLLRLAKTAVGSLLNRHAYCVPPVQHISIGNASTNVALEWRRRDVSVRGHGKEAAVSVAFDERASISAGNEFDLSLERPDRRSGLTLILEAGSLRSSVHLPAPGRLQMAWAAIAALPAALATVLRSTSDIYTFLRTGDAATASRLRKSFWITPHTDRTCILPRELLGSPSPPHLMPHATILVPVFNAADELALLLPRLASAPCPVVFVDDGSDDPRIASMLVDFAATHSNSKVISQRENMGFVAAVNTGLGDTKGHVILLNTDALPPEDWIAQLLSPMVEDDTVATVTPFSNNAEIISVPVPDMQSEVSDELVDRINTVARSIGGSHDTVEIPTGIGFCMAMNRRFLDKVGDFDHAFGRGYGEEVDWCLKASKAGGRHVALASLFVGHRGGASFGNQKLAMLKKSGKIIRERYPSYDHEVQTWVENAPAQAQTLALSMAWLDIVSDDPVPIFVGHSLGGGAETALQKDIDACLATGTPGLILLRAGGPSRWRVELKLQNATLIGDAKEASTVVKLLEPIRNRRLTYSCGVGARHPLDVPNLLLNLLTARATLDVHMHDFFPISPSWNLLNSSGKFRGVPGVQTNDLAHSVPPLDDRPATSHEEWRNEWSKVLSSADKVVTYSNSSRALVAEAYAGSVDKIVVRPHKLHSLPGALEKGGAAIGILGSINCAKGAEVLVRLSRATTNQRRLVVIGEVDGQYPLRRPHLVHGRFPHDQILTLAKYYDIGVWLIPSICPETFSFATHEALATGLPVLAFARGAQGEAVAAAPSGKPIQADPENTNAVLLEIEAAFNC